LTTVVAQLDYAVAKAWNITMGYWYEKYDFRDAFTAGDLLMPQSVYIFMKPDNGAFAAVVLAKPSQLLAPDRLTVAPPRRSPSVSLLEGWCPSRVSAFIVVAPPMTARPGTACSYALQIVRSTGRQRNVHSGAPAQRGWP
jgi:hypothetical protein